MSDGNPAVAARWRESAGASAAPAVLFARFVANTAALFVLPFLVGAITAMFCDVAQVGDTLGGLVRVAGLVLFPLLIVQAVGITAKVRRELAGLTPRPPGALLEALDRHARVLTDKGYGLLFASLFAVALALAFRFAELGVVAVLGLATLYLVATLGIALSARVGGRYEDRLAARGGAIGRVFEPTVTEAGGTVEECFQLDRVALPPGFNLRIHQLLPARLETETRHLVSAEASGRRFVVTRSLRRTPRGIYRIPPAEIAFSDLFGLTRIAATRAADAQLTVLPRFHPVVLGESPQVVSKREGPLTVLRRMPTDDYFRVRDYVPGDDTRRMHWKLSVRVGKLQVRVPETVPVARRQVRLLLDTFLGPYVGDHQGVLDDLMDRLVEVWLSLAKALVERGESVSLVLATTDPSRPCELVECRRGTQPRWRELGARAEWQRAVDVHQAAAAVESRSPARPANTEVRTVVVTARFAPLPELAHDASASWVFLPAGSMLPDALPGERPLLARALFFPFAAPAEENGLIAARRRNAARTTLERVRRYVVDVVERGSPAAEAVIRARNEPFYRVSRQGAAYVLEGG